MFSQTVENVCKQKGKNRKLSNWMRSVKCELIYGAISNISKIELHAPDPKLSFCNKIALFVTASKVKFMRNRHP